jgi:hypothetical protein
MKWVVTVLLPVVVVPLLLSMFTDWSPWLRIFSEYGDCWS